MGIPYRYTAMSCEPIPYVRTVVAWLELGVSGTVDVLVVHSDSVSEHLEFRVVSGGPNRSCRLIFRYFNIYFSIFRCFDIYVCKGFLSSYHTQTANSRCFTGGHGVSYIAS